MRDKENFRYNLERVREHFEKEMIPLKEASEWLGIDQRRIQREKPSPAKKVGGRWYISQLSLARWIS